ncbi:hypothetical protein [Cellulomonas sp. ATA003]|uniref:hypothetical protein n=1 Tax=Cellulomonas sp. ATA003 TaxID=3073064 RepID=UPI002873C431|nr:hypothetical protein [Cellulomonas sp. ATA003]WNB85734.1 hypothetical protein REH70_19915 [Cellulomonas sp. ATA003]
MWGLTVGYRRRSLNQLNGRVMLPWQWRVATALTVAGRVGLLLALVAVGAVLRRFGFGEELAPQGAATLVWVLALLAVVVTLGGASPGTALALRQVPDRQILLTLSPLTSGQHVAVTAVMPAVVETLTLTLAAAAVALPLWGLSSTAALAVAAVAGGAVVGSVLGLAALAALALVPARAGRARTLVLAAATGLVVGVALGVVAPVLVGRWRGWTAAEIGAALQRSVLDRVLVTRPPGWERLVDAGAPAVLGAALAVTLLAAPLAVVLLRRVARRHALAPVGPAARRAAPTTVAGRVWTAVAGRGDVAPTALRVVALVVVKDGLALRRLPAVAAAPVRRARALGAGATGAALGFAVAGGATHLHAVTWMAAGLAVAVIGVVAGVQDTVVPVAGIEAERRAWALLRSTPVPTGVLLVAKSVSVSRQVAGMVGAPLVAWCLVLGRSPAERVALVLLVVLLLAASGAGATLGSVLARRTEGSTQSLVERDPVATIIHGVALLVAVLPVVLAYTLAGDDVAPAVTAAVLLGLLVGVGAGVARSDTLTRRWR